MNVHLSLTLKDTNHSAKINPGAPSLTVNRGTVFVGTVTVASESLKKYKHMSCFILVLLPLQWNEANLDAYSQTSMSVPSLLSASDFVLPVRDLFMFTNVC